MKRRFGNSVIYLMVLGFAACSEQQSIDAIAWEQTVLSTIQTKRGNANAVYLDLKELPFEWDQFYVFTPYSTYDSINESLGFRWRGARKTRIHERDDINLLVFVKDGRVIQHVTQVRFEGDFSTLRAAEAYTPDESFFEIRVENPAEPWLYIYEASRESLSRIEASGNG